jgi:hypothetical protein
VRELWKIPLVFNREIDYDRIYDQNLETEFEVKVYLSSDDDLDDYIWRGRFTRMSCDIDEDDKLIRVDPVNFDRYYNFLNGLDKEWNLIDLAPEIVSVNLVRRPIVQVHIGGSGIVGNFLGGVYWEEVLSGDFNEASIIKNGFVIPGDSGVINPDVSGFYNYDGGTNEHGREDLGYYIKYNPSFGITAWEILEFGTNLPVFRAGSGESLPTFGDPFNPGSISFVSLVDGSEVELYGMNWLSRILTNKSDVNGSGTVVIPVGDHNEENEIYNRVIDFNSASGWGLAQIRQVFTQGFDHSEDPDKYGKYRDDVLHFGGEYFVRPGSGFYPIQRHSWSGYGLWLFYSPDMIDLLDEASEEVEIEDCYKLSDVIKVLVNKIDPELNWGEDGDYSDFFFAANSIRGTQRIPVITPKSNLLKGNYDQPAQRAIIKMSDVLLMLKSVFNVYFDIYEGEIGELRLRLEHVNFYERGGQYYLDNVGVDLSDDIEGKTGENWGYRLNRYKFEQSEIPERISWSWMDKQSDVFEGWPMEMISVYAEKGNLEERSCGIFSADVDYMMGNTQDIANDGFVLFDCDQDGGMLSLPFLNMSDYGFDGVVAQNGYLSLPWLNKNYHRWGLPCHNINVNGEDDTAITEKRTKVQEVEFGEVEGEINGLELVVTGLGVGEIDELEENIYFGYYKGKIKHDIL